MGGTSYERYRNDIGVTVPERCLIIILILRSERGEFVGDFGVD